MSESPRPVMLISNHGEIVGGGELSFLDLVKTLNRTQWNPCVVVPGEGEVFRQCRKEGLATSVVPLPSLRYPNVHVIGSLVKLCKLARETRAEVIHANGSRAMFYAGVVGIWLKIPVMWHVRISDTEPLWDWVLSKLATLIIVNSKAVGNRFHGRTLEKVCCVYNGVDLRRFVPREPSKEVQAQLGLHNKGPIVLSVGRFVHFKGYVHLLEAAEVVNRVMPTVQWILVGDGELKEALQEQAQALGLMDHVHFVGWQTEIPEWLSLCDVFVLPSLKEHFGRVLIEAMAMAKPVVATAAGGVPEIIEDKSTGLLVPPSCPLRLAEEILSLLQNKAWGKQIGEAGRQRVEQKFSLSAHVLGIEALWQKTLGVLHGRV